MSPSPQDLQTLGWTLVHFVWQGAGCALVLASADLVLRRAAPQARYLAACATLTVMGLLPVATFGMVRASVSASGAVVASAIPAGTEPFAVERGAGPEGTRTIGWRQRVEPWLPGLVGLWGVGVALLSLRGLGGYLLVQRLRRVGLSQGPALDLTLARLIAVMRVSAPVRLYESALVQVPTALGWLRPVILLPASAVIGLAPEQLELIVAHELAHVRRHDYLVNLLQSAVETLLFYHPAVWWVSERMRVEREHCCDDLAAAAAGTPLRYARALAALEELCVRQGGRPPALAMAATEGSLFTRIARLLAPPRHAPRASRGLAGALALVALCLALGVGSSLIAVPTAAVATPSFLIETTETTPSREGRAFPLERVLEMARGGLTPEYVDDMDALGYSALTAEQLMALHDQGVGPSFIQEMAQAGFAKLSTDQLLSLRSQGVSGEYVAELKAQGLRDLSLGDLTELRSQGVSGEYVAELKQAGYDGLSVSRLIALRNQGVSGRYAAELKALGYEDLSPMKLIALRAQGVTADYVRAWRAAGYEELSAGLLIELRAHGVRPESTQELQSLGLGKLTPGALIELQNHGVDPRFVREMKEAGLTKLTPEELIEMRDRGMNGALLKRLRERQ